jgi:hypothetical protein
MATVYYKLGPGIRQTIKKKIAARLGNKMFNMAVSAGVPAGTANTIGDLCYDTTNADLYCATAASTWTKIVD